MKNNTILLTDTFTATDGTQSWQTQYRDTGTPVVSGSSTSNGTNRVETSVAPDNSSTVSVYAGGQLATVTRYDATPTQISQTTYGYDAFGRQASVTDARNGTTTFTYDNADELVSTTTPVPGTGISAQTTTTLYDNLGRTAGILNPDGTTVTNIYLPTGELSLTYGSRTYPVGYTYDYAGRMSTMTAWSGFAAGTGTGARVTTWNYDPYRGFLTNKAYADGLGPVYAYTPGGRLASRTWARTDTNNNPIVTTYGYDLTGSLTNIVYTNGTPCVTNSYDRLGRLSTVLQNGMTDTLNYNLAGGLLGETFSGGVLDGLTVTNGYDAYLRRTNLAVVKAGSGRLTSTTYGYDDASRLATVSDGTNSAAYTYVANSPLVGQIVFQHNGATRMTTTKAYDYLNRLTQISSAPSAAYTLPQTFNYNYNPANQRTRDTLADGSYWVYGYDSLGQVTNGCKYFADGTPVVGQQFDYAFDTIGNRTQTQTGGDANGANLRVANYYANNLNQLTNRYVPPYVDITGASILTNAVTVNGQTAYRKEEYFRQELPVNNTNSALWTNIIVAGGQSVTGNVFVAQEPEKFKYDADGNLTNDGRWVYVWDAENRLVQMTVNTNVGPQYQLNFAYDAKGRRIQKVVTTNGVAYSTNNFVYDGWNLAATLNPQSSILASFTWGSDLSGSQQGAGGVGGLLWSQFYTNSLLQAASFYAYDGNGNVAALISVADGTLAANYEYGPFGEVIRATGPMSKLNPFRYSTKYQDDETDFLYYGYRYYNPSTGRWLSRDPLGEPGFRGHKFANVSKEDVDKLSLLDSEDDIQELLSDGGLQQSVSQTLYVMCGNDPIQNVDINGLICDVVANRTKALMSSGINAGHEWIVYGGNSVGFWPNRGYVVLRPDPAAQAGVPIYWQWETVQKKSGTIKWGSGAGKSCACATCADILASIDAAPNPGWHSFPIRNNCRRFVKFVFAGSCLEKGKETSFNP